MTSADALLSIDRFSSQFPYKIPENSEISDKHAQFENDYQKSDVKAIIFGLQNTMSGSNAILQIIRITEQKIFFQNLINIQIALCSKESTRTF